MSSELTNCLSVDDDDDDDDDDDLSLNYYRVFAPVLDSACTRHPRISDSTGVIAPVPSSTW